MENYDFTQQGSCILNELLNEILLVWFKDRKLHDCYLEYDLMSSSKSKCRIITICIVGVELSYGIDGPLYIIFIYYFACCEAFSLIL